MEVTLIGIDCATDPAKVGMALGTFRSERTIVEGVALGSADEPPSVVVTEWMRGRAGPILIALDAPLGWPVALADALPGHTAGGWMAASAHELFRRWTDRFVRERVGKQSLDVGADRIARTAHSALALLQAVRESLAVEIALVWRPRFDGVGAIEVYPAATLEAHRIESRGYKAASGENARRRVLAAVGDRLELATTVPGLSRSSDGVDAVVCLLAADDFLRDAALYPPVDAPVQREGWIWVRDPHIRLGDAVSSAEAATL